MIKWLCLFSFAFLPLFAAQETKGISQAESYKNNSGLQWTLATESLKLIQFNNDDVILDVGCGDGKITAYIADQISNGTITGMDISDKMVKLASSNFAKPRRDFIQGSAESIPFKRQFTKLVSFNTLHWVLNQQKALESMRDALRDDGTMLLVLPAKSANNIGILSEKLAKTSKWSTHFPHMKQERIYFTPEEYKELLAQARLKAEIFDLFQGKSTFANKEALMAWIRPLITFTGHLLPDLREEFVKDIATEIMLIDPPSPDGSITVHFSTMRIVATKS